MPPRRRYSLYFWPFQLLADLISDWLESRDRRRRMQERKRRNEERPGEEPEYWEEFR